MLSQSEGLISEAADDLAWLLKSSEGVYWHWPDCESDFCHWSKLPESLDVLGLAAFPSNVWGFADLIDSESRSAFEALISQARWAPKLEVPPFEILLRLGKAAVWMRVSGIERTGEQNKGLRALLMNISPSKLAEACAREESEHKSEFLGRMSHDMRTPLHAIIGLSEMLKEHMGGSESQGIIDRIEESAETLLGLVNDLLDAEQIRTGKLKLELSRVELRRVIRDCVSLYEQTRRNHQVELRCTMDSSLPVYVKSDRRRLLQVLNNLLSNAFKFTMEGEVCIDVSIASKRGGTYDVRFAVRDTGLGIAAGDIPHLFKSFYRGTFFGPSQPKGQGLGLAISRDIVESFGGHLHVESAQGVGSTFSFVIPLEECTALVESQERTGASSEICPIRPEEAVDLRAGASCSPQGRSSNTSAMAPHPRTKILVADDSSINRQIVGAYLKGESYDVFFAVDGLEALSIYQTERPALSLLDLRMPNMGGIEAARRIRAYEKLEGLPHRPIIAISASTLKSDVAEALHAGFDAHVAKPVRRPELLQMIRESLNS